MNLKREFYICFTMPVDPSKEIPENWLVLKSIVRTNQRYETLWRDRLIYSLVCYKHFSLPKKLEMTSPRQHKTGRGYASQFSWQSRTDRLRCQLYQVPHHLLSELWRNPLEIARKSRIVSGPFLISFFAWKNCLGNFSCNLCCHFVALLQHKLYETA